MGKLMSILLKQPKFLRDTFINTYGYWIKSKRFEKRFWEYYRYLRYEHQHQSLEKLKEEQLSALTRIIRHAYENTKYYKSVFDQYGISPRNIQDFEDIKKIPLLKREDIVKNLNRMVAKNFKGKLVRHYSSGTTGQKLVFYLPYELRWPINHAYFYLLYSWGGIEPFDKRVTIGARIFALKPPYWSFNRAENQLLLSIHHLTPKTALEYLSLIKWFKPKFIQGHPSGIFYLAQVALENDMVLPVKAIFTTGETLYEDQLSTIEKAFKTVVYQTYGLGESVIMAGTCKQNGYFHEITNYGYIEILDNGKIVGTSLLNYGMPFIRYVVGDIGTSAEENSEKCSVTNYPAKLKKIVGRIDDIIRVDDKVILPVSIRMTIKPILRSGENYQLIQIDERDFELLFQSKRPKEEFKNLKKLLYSILSKVLPDNVKLNIEFVEQIPHKGKIRNVVSLLRKKGGE